MDNKQIIGQPGKWTSNKENNIEKTITYSYPRSKSQVKYSKNLMRDINKMVFHQQTNYNAMNQYYWVVVIVAATFFILLPLVAWIWRSCRWHYSRYDYTALEDNQSVHEKLEMERKVLRSQARETAFLTCQYYLKGTGRYVLLEQLGDIGSRQNKFWFLVRDTTLKTERLLTMLPQTLHSPVHFSSVSKQTLSELFLALQHPYIYPVLDVDVKTLTDDEYVMVILPYNNKGSLKDIIHKARCQADWHDKYHHPSNGLPIATVQRLGRQILEALLFLQDRGFYPFGHLHCGNVIIQNGVSRLTGFEDTLLGYTSRCSSLVRKKLRDNYESIDVICFGHVLFEMCAGYELNCAHPTSRHLEELQRTYPEIVEILKFIFEQEDSTYPSVDEISLLDFFRNMDLREMRSMPVPQLFQAQLSPEIQDLLLEVRLWHLSQHKWSTPEKTPNPSTSSFFNNDIDGTVEEESSEDDVQLESSFMYGCCISERNTPNCTKRVRSSSTADNDHHVTRTTAVLETKGGRLKKRRSNSICSNNVEDTDACTSLLTCKAESRLTTPYVSTLDITMSFVNNDLRTNVNEEFHTPPNSPPIHSKRLLEEPLVLLTNPTGDSNKLPNDFHIVDSVVEDNNDATV